MRIRVTHCGPQLFPFYWRIFSIVKPNGPGCSGNATCTSSCACPDMQSARQLYPVPHVHTYLEPSIYLPKTSVLPGAARRGAAGGGAPRGGGAAGGGGGGAAAGGTPEC